MHHPSSKQLLSPSMSTIPYDTRHETMMRHDEWNFYDYVISERNQYVSAPFSTSNHAREKGNLHKYALHWDVFCIHDSTEETLHECPSFRWESV